MLKIFIDSNIQVIVRMALADPGGRGGLGVATPPPPPPPQPLHGPLRETQKQAKTVYLVRCGKVVTSPLTIFWIRSSMA